MIWTKGAHQSAKFRLSTAQVKFKKNCTLIRSFCWKYIKFQYKKHRGVLSYDTEEECKKQLEFSDIYIYITFDLKKYRGIVFHDTKEWCKIWRKTGLRFGKWHEEFSKFSPEQMKVSKLGLWWELFIQN